MCGDCGRAVKALDCESGNLGSTPSSHTNMGRQLDRPSGGLKIRRRWFESTLSHHFNGRDRGGR